MPHRRVLSILHTDSALGWGGQGLRILLEATELRKRGHRLHIAAPAGSQLLRRAQERGFTTFAVPFAAALHLRSVLMLRNLLREHRIDVLSTHSAVDSWCGGLASRLASGVAVVRTRQPGSPLRTGFWARWTRARAARAVITTGEALRLRLIADHGLDGERILAIPTGVDLERFTPARHDGARFRAELGIAADQPLIGTVAMLRPAKGHQVLLTAFAALLQTHPRLRLVVVGDDPDAAGPAKAALQAQAAQLGIAANVTWTGYREDIPEVLAALDCVVLASTADEGVPQSLTQALAMGRPVVGTAIGSVAEAVLAERTGLLVPPGDAKALASALAAVFDDPAAARKRANAGQELVRNRYGLTAMADRIEELYECLCGGS